jgi:hypothetical protein
MMSVALGGAGLQCVRENVSDRCLCACLHPPMGSSVVSSRAEKYFRPGLAVAQGVQAGQVVGQGSPRELCRHFGQTPSAELPHPALLFQHS